MPGSLLDKALSNEGVNPLPSPTRGRSLLDRATEMVAKPTPMGVSLLDEALGTATTKTIPKMLMEEGASPAPATVPPEQPIRAGWYEGPDIPQEWKKPAVALTPQFTAWEPSPFTFDKAVNTAWDETLRIGATAFNSAAFGLPKAATEIAGGKYPEPQTPVGNLLYAPADFAGMVMGGPLRIGAKIVDRMLGKFASSTFFKSTALLPTMTLLRETVPSAMEAENIPDFLKKEGADALGAAAIGAVFPFFGGIKSPVVRTAVGMAIMDLIAAKRTGQGWTTIDDTVKAIKEGKLDARAIGMVATGHILDAFFSYTVGKPGFVQNKALIDFMQQKVQELKDEAIVKAGGTVPGGRKWVQEELLPKELPEEGLQAGTKLGGAAPQPEVAPPVQMSREEFNKKVLYRGVGQANLAGPNAYWTDRPGRAADYARMHGETGRIRVSFKNMVPKDMLWLGDEPATVDELLAHYGEVGIGSHIADQMPVVAEIPIEAASDPYGYLTTIGRLRPPTPEKLVEATLVEEAKPAVVEQGYKTKEAEIIDVHQEAIKSKWGDVYVDPYEEMFKDLKKGEYPGPQITNTADRIDAAYKAGLIKSVDDIKNLIHTEGFFEAESTEKGMMKLAKSMVKTKQPPLVEPPTKQPPKVEEPPTFPTAPREGKEANVYGGFEPPGAKPPKGKQLDLLRSLPKEMQPETPTLADVDLARGFERRVEESQKAIDKYKRSMELGRWPARIWDTAYAPKHLLRKLGYWGEYAIKQFELSSGFTARARTEANDVISEVFGGIGGGQRDLLNKLVFAKGVISAEARKPNLKTAEELSTPYAQGFINTLRATDPTAFDELNRRADIFFEAPKRLVEAAYGNQMIPQEMRDALLATKDYLQRKFINYIDPEVDRTTQGGSTYSVKLSGFEEIVETQERRAKGAKSVGELPFRKLETGSTAAMETDTRLLLHETFQRVYGAIAKNKANQVLYAMAEKEMGTKRPGGEGGLLSLKQKAGYTKLNLFVNGEPKSVWMLNEAAQGWKSAPPLLGRDFATFLSWITWTTPIKMAATGYNPEFSERNLFRDAQYIFLTTKEYSTIDPVALKQIIEDLGETMKDAWNRDGVFNDYVKQGGLMPFLATQAKLGKGPINDPISFLHEAGSSLGEFTEIWMRLALRSRALKNGKSGMEATHIARTYLDFSQGGSWVKAIDAVWPYFNANVQATRGLFRAASTDPIIFGAKAAQILVTQFGISFASYAIFGQLADQMSVNDRDRYWCIPTGIHRKDKQGNDSLMYVRVAKDQGQMVLGTMADELARGVFGLPVDVSRLGKSVFSLVNITIDKGIPLPPIATVVNGWISNWDSWREKQITPYPDVKPGEQYTGREPGWLIEIGKELNISAPKMAYALSVMLPSSNTWIYAMNGGLEFLFRHSPEDMKYYFSEQAITRLPGIRPFIGWTSPARSETDIIREQQSAEATDQRVRSRDFGEILKRIEQIKSPEEAKAFIKGQPLTTRPGLISKANVEMARKEPLTGVSKWNSLRALSPEYRAKAYFGIWTKLDIKGREEMDRIAKTMKEFNQWKFLQDVKKLKGTSK